MAAAVTVATFLVRLAFPFNSENKYLDLNARRRGETGWVHDVCPVTAD